MWEKSEGAMGTLHHMGKGKWAEMMMWEKLDEEAKKQLMMRKLDERIMKKEFKIEYLQHKVETLKMMKTWMEKL
ncbi:MAG: hypothetical protein WBZ42_05705 [Halobacteriota archaeon]